MAGPLPISLPILADTSGWRACSLCKDFVKVLAGKSGHAEKRLARSPWNPAIIKKFQLVNCHAQVG
jgi:hypothetical protein